MAQPERSADQERSSPLVRIIGLITLPSVMLLFWMLCPLSRYALAPMAFLIANPLAIAMTLIALVLLLRNREWKSAFAVSVTFVGLLVFSFFPVWFQHTTIFQPGGDPHWHYYWEMLHVH